MFDEKKRDELEALMAAWVGEVGQLNRAVQELPAVFLRSLAEIETEFKSATGRIGHAFDSYDVRSDKLYQQLLEANAQLQKSTEAIAGAAGHGVDTLRDHMESVTKQAATVVEVMLALQNAVNGDNGLTHRIRGIEVAFGDKVWMLDKHINSLSSMQVSKLAQHQKAISAMTTLLVASLAFCAGAGVTSNPWLGAIGVGVLLVGVGVGVLCGWLFTYKKQQ